MTRQLAKAPSEALLHVDWDQKKIESQARIGDALTDVVCLTRDVSLQPVPVDALPRSFSIEWTQDLQRGKSRAVVLDGIMADLERFYGLVVEGIVSFIPKAPKLPTTAEPGTVPERLVEEAAVPVVEPDGPAESALLAHDATPAATADLGKRRSREPTPSTPPDRVANGRDSPASPELG